MRRASSLARLKHEVRERAEHHLRLAAMDEMRRRYPAGTSEPYHPKEGRFWRLVFVPLYRRVPWSAKERAMHALRMTAETSGWTPPPRLPADPWRPPAPPAPPG